MYKTAWVVAGAVLLLVTGCPDTDPVDDGTDPIHLSGSPGGGSTPGAQDAVADDAGDAEASSWSDAGEALDAKSTLPPEFKECQNAQECDSGYCVPGPDGKVCSPICDGKCPDGWLCKELDSLVNPVSICVYPHLVLCRPCAIDNDCVQALWGASNHCVPHGDDGSFCGVECDALSPCPNGYLCQPAVTRGGSVVNQCMPLGGECKCTEKFVAIGAKTTCSVANPIGTCFGERVCEAGGLSACDAATPQPESCNGKDDNCNGLVDDGDLCPAGQACEGGNCVGGCQPETCNGKDDDCNGLVDDGNLCPAGQECVAGNCVAGCQPVNGGWSQWSCGPCPVECGMGNKTCTRTCTNPAPACGGNVCVGQSSKTESCSANCPPGKQCVNGSCVADLCKPDPCNGHGWCVHNTGACICDPGYTGAKCKDCLSPWIWSSGDGACRPLSGMDGTEGNDLVVGTASPEFIRGLGGNDEIKGMEGDDFVNGNVGADFVNGNVGRDEVRGGSDADTCHGGSEDDFVSGDMGDDNVYGDLGNDRLIGGQGNDWLYGEAGNDYYMIDGLGNDYFSDTSGTDAARCMDGVTAISDTMVGSNRVLTLNTGGSVTILNNSVENVYGCE